MSDLGFREVHTLRRLAEQRKGRRAVCMRVWYSRDHRKRRQFAQGRRVRWATKRQVPVSDAHLVEVFKVRFGIAVVPLVCHRPSPAGQKSAPRTLWVHSAASKRKGLKCDKDKM